jgi:hypothetical protein
MTGGDASARSRINLVMARQAYPSRKNPLAMTEILNLAVPYFGLIFIGFACGKAKGLSETGSPG